MEIKQAEKIKLINELVEDYKKNGNNESAEKIIEMFKPFILKNCYKFNKLYPGVHEWSSIEQEATWIFYQLLNEYTLGGAAYFNVFIVRKLPFRLRYFFVKEIKHRSRNLCYNEDQMMIYNTFDGSNDIDDLINNINDQEQLKMIKGLIESDLLNDREREIFKANMSGKTHKEISEMFNISRPRVTKIINDIIIKIKQEIDEYYNFQGDHNE